MGAGWGREEGSAKAGQKRDRIQAEQGAGQVRVGERVRGGGIGDVSEVGRDGERRGEEGARGRQWTPVPAGYRSGNRGEFGGGVNTAAYL